MKLRPVVLPEPGKINFDAIDPLDSRYFDAEVARYLSEKSRIAYQAHVEAALAYTLAEAGICSKKIAVEIETSARKVTAQEVFEQEKTTKHDIKALVNCIRFNLSDEAKPYVHFGATSYDIIATANTLQLRDVSQQVIVPRLRKLLKTLIALTDQYAGTPQIGRTHGQHAVPITFGFSVAEYVSRLGTSMEAVEALSQELVGKFSGAVGAYNALSVFVDDPLEFEKAVLGKVKLKPAEYSTQIVPPETTVRLIDELVIVAGVMANLGHDMRHLQRSEIGEVQERFEKGQTGSSTMAHKRNPWNFENVVSMSKQVIAQGVNSNLNLSSEHQRDLTDSASSRFYTLAFAGVASITSRLDRIMNKLEVNEEAMQRNLKLGAGAIAAEPLYLLLEKHGHILAHEKAKNLAHEALAKKKPLVDIIVGDAETSAYWQKFTAEEKKIISCPEEHYTGLAERKAKSIAAIWRKKLAKS
jgi:adenylosuccinate lyase